MKGGIAFKNVGVDGSTILKSVFKDQMLLLLSE
jgi:hypothetical protein